jgi:hypothetical protein
VVVGITLQHAAKKNLQYTHKTELLSVPLSFNYLLWNFTPRFCVYCYPDIASWERNNGLTLYAVISKSTDLTLLARRPTFNIVFRSGNTLE